MVFSNTQSGCQSSHLRHPVIEICECSK
jgi:hypothetical protein